MMRMLVLLMFAVLLVRPAVAQTDDVILNDALKILGFSASIGAFREGCAEPIATAPPLGEAFDGWTERNRSWTIIAVTTIGARGGVDPTVVEQVRNEWMDKARGNFERSTDIPGLCINLAMLINGGAMDIAKGMVAETTRLNEASQGKWPLAQAAPPLDMSADPAPVRDAMTLLAVFALRKEMAERCSVALPGEPDADFAYDYQWWRDDNAAHETAARAVLEKWGANTPEREERLIADARAAADAEFAASPDSLECYDYLRFQPSDVEIAEGFPAEAESVRVAAEMGP